MEPAPGFELGTSALRKHCSTTELSWLGAGNPSTHPALRDSLRAGSRLSAGEPGIIDSLMS